MFIVEHQSRQTQNYNNDGEKKPSNLKNEKWMNSIITGKTENEEAPHKVVRSYKLGTRQDNNGKLRMSINIVHDQGSKSEQVKVISIPSNEKGLVGRNRWRYDKNMLFVFIDPSELFWLCLPNGQEFEPKGFYTTLNFPNMFFQANIIVCL